MNNAKLNVVHFSENDVIATSYAKLTIAGTWDGESGNASVTIGTTTYGNGGSAISGLIHIES